MPTIWLTMRHPDQQSRPNLSRYLYSTQINIEKNMATISAQNANIGLFVDLNSKSYIGFRNLFNPKKPTESSGFESTHSDNNIVYCNDTNQIGKYLEQRPNITNLNLATSLENQELSQLMSDIDSQWPNLDVEIYHKKTKTISNEMYAKQLRDISIKNSVINQDELSVATVELFAKYEISVISFGCESLRDIAKSEFYKAKAVISPNLEKLLA